MNVPGRSYRHPAWTRYLQCSPAEFRTIWLSHVNGVPGPNTRAAEDTCSRQATVFWSSLSLSRRPHPTSPSISNLSSLRSPLNSPRLPHRPKHLKPSHQDKQVPRVSFTPRPGQQSVSAVSISIISLSLPIRTVPTVSEQLYKFQTGLERHWVSPLFGPHEADFSRIRRS